MELSGDNEQARMNYCGPLAESLAVLINNERFSDVTFLVGCDEMLGGVQKICASRNILAARSPVFEAMLYGPMIEAKSSEEIPIPDITPDAFLTMLRYIYTDKVDMLTETNVVNALTCSTRFLVATLSRSCMQFITKKLSVPNVCRFMTQGRRNEELVELCTNFIGRNGDKVFASDGLKYLPKSLIIELLKSDSMSVSSEIKVFHGCLRWAEEHMSEEERALPEDQRREVRKQIFSDIVRYIRFPLMSAEEIVLQVWDTKVLDDDTIRVLLTFLHTKGETQDKCEFNSNPRKVYLTEHMMDFDKSGVIYWLGTKGKTRPFKNPHTDPSCDLRVSASSLGDQGKLEHIVSREKNHTWTSSDEGQWFCIDLGKSMRLVPTKYTLRHGCDNGDDDEEDDYLRNWIFEGSVSGNDWTRLRVHIQDKSIFGPYATHTWEINQKNQKTFYRFFRIRSTGLNSSDDHVVVICGIELYGELYTALFDKEFENR